MFIPRKVLRDLHMLGHQKVLETLKAAIERDNVGHAYIFEGPDGIGRRETARAFAAMLLCGGEDAPCGQCKRCELFEQGSNPDFQEIYTRDKSIGVEDVRDLLRTLIIRPMYSKYKVIIINDMDKMTIQAQNALLKSLEEPPAYVVFVLTVQAASAVAPTILSRCQKILFTKLSDGEILHILQSQNLPADSNLDFIVSYADGVIGTALELIASPETIQLRDDIIEAMSEFIRSDNPDIFKTYDIFEKNSDRTDYILGVLLLYFRDILLYHMTGKFALLINSDKKDMIIGCTGTPRYANIPLNASTSRNEGLTYSGIIKCIKTIWETQKSLKSNANFQLAMDVMLLKIKDYLNKS